MGFSLLLLKDLVHSSWGQSSDAQGFTQLLLSLLFPAQTVQWIPYLSDSLRSLAKDKSCHGQAFW